MSGWPIRGDPGGDGIFYDFKVLPHRLFICLKKELKAQNGVIWPLGHILILIFSTHLRNVTF